MKIMERFVPAENDDLNEGVVREELVAKAEARCIEELVAENEALHRRVRELEHDLEKVKAA